MLKTLTITVSILIVLFMIASCTIITSVLLKGQGDFFSFAMAFGDRSLIINHNVQAEQQKNNCLYSISVAVSDSVTKKPISGSLVEFYTHSKFLTNKTDINGSVQIPLILSGESGRSCMETLLSQGYTIEASKVGYGEYGIARIS